MVCLAHPAHHSPRIAVISSAEILLISLISPWDGLCPQNTYCHPLRSVSHTHWVLVQIIPITKQVKSSVRVAPLNSTHTGICKQISPTDSRWASASESESASVSKPNYWKAGSPL